MLTKELTKILESKEFISVGTCDFKGRPNAAPKFLLKVEADLVYLVDYTIGTTWVNLKQNPLASLSIMDPRTLKGYQFNGTVRVIDKGPLFKKLCKEMQTKAIRLTVKHIIEDVHSETNRESYEAVITEKYVIYEVKITDTAEIGIRGELKRYKAST